jgi:hypothetical protein
MPKIKDLGISAIPLAREENDRGAPMYWMCNPDISNNTRPEPTPPQCHPTPTPKPVRALPDDAVIQLRRQFRQQLSR